MSGNVLIFFFFICYSKLSLSNLSLTSFPLLFRPLRFSNILLCRALQSQFRQSSFPALTYTCSCTFCHYWRIRGHRQCHIFQGTPSIMTKTLLKGKSDTPVLEKVQNCQDNRRKDIPKFFNSLSSLIFTIHLIFFTNRGLSTLPIQTMCA